MKQEAKRMTEEKIKELEMEIRGFQTGVETCMIKEKGNVLHAIEERWSNLRGRTDKIYSDLIGCYLRGVDEKEIVRQKK